MIKYVLERALRFLVLLLMLLSVNAIGQYSTSSVRTVSAQATQPNLIFLPLAVFAPVSMHALAVVDTTLYVGVDTSLRVVDVTDPAQPIQRAVLALPHPPRRIIARAPLLYVLTRADESDANTVTIVDVTDPARPRVIREQVFPTADDITLAGTTLYVRGCTTPDVAGSPPVCTLFVVNVTDPRQPQQITTYDLQTPNRGISAGRLQVDNDLLYFAYGFVPTLCCSESVLDILDVRDPKQIMRVGQWRRGTGMRAGLVDDLAVAGTNAYIGTSAGLIIVDVRDPRAPQEVGGIFVPHGLQSLEVRDGLVYATRNVTNTVTILDARNTTTVTKMADLATTGEAPVIEVAGDRAYVIDTQAGVLILDVRDPARPQRVGVFRLRP